MWEVVHLVGDMWENTWTKIDCFNHETPEEFLTREEAQMALDDFLEEVNSGKHDIFPYDSDQFMVREVTYPPEGEGVCFNVCDFYKDLYNFMYGDLMQDGYFSEIVQKLGKESLEKKLGEKLSRDKYLGILTELTFELLNILKFQIGSGRLEDLSKEIGG